MTTLALVLLVLAALADTWTTRVGLALGAVELNPVLGKHPSTWRILAVKAVVVVQAYLAMRWNAHTVWAVFGVAIFWGYLAAKNYRIVGMLRGR